MNPANRYSLWLGVGALTLAGAGVAALWKRSVGAAIAGVALVGGAAMWRALRFGGSTLASPAGLESLLGAGTPVLVEVFSDT